MVEGPARRTVSGSKTGKNPAGVPVDGHDKEEDDKPKDHHIEALQAQVQEFWGKGWNACLGAITGYDAKKVVDHISPELAQSFQRGEGLQAAISKGKQESSLTEQERKDLASYHAIHDKISKELPFFDAHTLQKTIEDGIRAKAESNKQGGSNEGVRQGASVDQRAGSPDQTATVHDQKPAGREPVRAEQNDDWMGKFLHQTDKAVSNVAAGFGNVINAGVTGVSGHKPEEIVQQITPEATLTLDRGRRIQEEIDSGARNEKALTAHQRQDLANFHKYHEDLRKVPFFEQNALKQSVDEAIRQRASEIRQTQPDLEKRTLDGANKSPSGSGEPRAKGSDVLVQVQDGSKTPASGSKTESQGDRKPGVSNQDARLDSGKGPGSRLPEVDATTREQGRKPVQAQGDRPTGVSQPVLKLDEQKSQSKSQAPESRSQDQRQHGERMPDRSQQAEKVRTGAGDIKAQDQRQPGARAQDQKASGEKGQDQKVQADRSQQARYQVEKAPGERQPQARNSDQKTGDDKTMSRKAQEAPAGKDTGQAYSKGSPAAGPGEKGAGARAGDAGQKADARKPGEASAPGAERAKGSESARGIARAEAARNTELRAQGLASQLSVANLARGIKSLQETAKGSPPAGGDASKASARPNVVLKGSVEAARSIQRFESLARISQPPGGRTSDAGRSLRGDQGVRQPLSVPAGAVRGVIGRTLVVLEPARTGRAGPGQTRGDAPPRTEPQGASRIDPARPFSFREPRAFTTPTRIDRRYILGTEVALAAVIAAAGIARNRPDRALSGAQPGERRPPTDGRAPSARVDAGARKFDETRKPTDKLSPDGRSFVCSTRITDKRYITGTEFALAAMLAAAGAARNRPDVVKPNVNEAQLIDPKAIQGEKPEEDKAVRQPRQEGPGDQSDSADAPGVRETKAEAESMVNQTDMSSEKAQRKGKDKDKQKEKEDTQQQYQELIDALAEKAIKASAEAAGSRGTVLHRPTVLVSTRDTLVSIAESYFHDPNLAWLIADLNSHNIEESWVDGKRVVELKSRQSLELPVWQDITEFLENRPPEARPENIVTIVAETQVNREVLDNVLRTAMGVASSSVDPFQKPAQAKPAPLMKAPGRQLRWSLKRFLTDPR